MHIVVYGDVQPGGSQRINAVLLMPGFGQPLIGDEKDARPSQLSRQLPQPINGSGSIDNTRLRVIVKRRKEIGGRNESDVVIVRRKILHGVIRFR